MIIVYAEDAPVKSSVPSWGMSKVNGRFLDSKEPPKIFFCPNLLGNQTFDEVPNEMGNIHLGKSGKYLRYLYRVSPKIVGFIKLKFEIHIFYRKFAPFINERTIILGSFGSDVNSVIRFKYFQEQLKLPYACYFVDEIISFSSLKGGNSEKATDVMKVIMRRSIANYTITEGLREYYRCLFSVNSKTVGLPKEKKLRLCDFDEKRQIIHVGGVGDFYREGIKHMAEYLSSHNSRYPNSKIYLRLTVPEIPNYLKPYSNHVHVGRLSNDLDLFNEIHKSACAFLPYDHKGEFSLQTKTSFPSKTIAYLTYARRIFYLGSNETSFYNLLGSVHQITFCTDLKQFENKLNECLQKEPCDFSGHSIKLPNTDIMFNDLVDLYKKMRQNDLLYKLCR